MVHIPLSTVWGGRGGGENFKIYLKFQSPKKKSPGQFRPKEFSQLVLSPPRGELSLLPARPRPILGECERGKKKGRDGWGRCSFPLPAPDVLRKDRGTSPGVPRNEKRQKEKKEEAGLNGSQDLEKKKKFDIN